MSPFFRCVSLPAPLLNRLRFDARVRFIAGHDFSWDLEVQQVFDVFQKLVLVDAYQRDRLAVAPRARRASDAMHVVLWHMRQFIIHDVRQ